VVVAPLLLASLVVAASPAASDGARVYARTIAAIRTQAVPRTEQCVVTTDSAGMTFAVALRGPDLGVEFPFPGPAAHHRYRLAVDRRTLRADAERLDARGRVVAGPIRGRAALLYPLTAPEAFRFIESYAGAPTRDPYRRSAYRIRDLGGEDLDGQRVEHLAFVARGDPSTDSLTDVYADAATGLPHRIVAEIRLRAAAGLAVRFRFDFGWSAHRWIVTSSSVHARAQLGARVTRSGRVDVRLEHADFDRPLANERR
jgi:hypothetical protein